MSQSDQPDLEQVDVGNLSVRVAVAGAGPAMILLHGWPHTWRLWDEVMGPLAQTHRVIAPDLRGVGGTTRAESGYDMATIAGDVLGLMAALDVRSATIVAIDASVPAAWYLAMTHPESVRTLVLMESLLPGLPGAESFLGAGPPWWFGFHAVPGLAESVLVGSEAAYLDFFLRAGTFDGRGVPADMRAHFIDAYEGSEAMRCGFEYYRTGDRNRLLAQQVAANRLEVPTLALGGNQVGRALQDQLVLLGDRIEGRLLPDCGHLVPVDQPESLVSALERFDR